MSRALFPILAAVLPACLGEPAVGAAVPGGGTVPLAAVFSSIDGVVLSPRCATCHDGASGTPLTLSPESAYLELVGVASTQVPDLLLVAPSEPAASYLLSKLRGTQAQVGGSGDQMPPGGDALSEDEIAAIESWIASGAPND